MITKFIKRDVFIGLLKATLIWVLMVPVFQQWRWRNCITLMPMVAENAQEIVIPARVENNLVNFNPLINKQ